MIKFFVHPGLFLLVISAIAGCSNNGGDNGGVGSSTPEVTRGAFNEPYIRLKGTYSDSAEAERALYRKQGYVMAKDRFLQMDILRRSVQGRLADLLGEKALEKDYTVHGLGLPMSVEKSASRIIKEFPEVYQELVAFSEGVNEYLSELKNATRDDKDNWVLLNRYKSWTFNSAYVPDPWTPTDSVSIGTGLSFNLSSEFDVKLLLGALHLALVLKTEPAKLSEAVAKTFNRIINPKAVYSNVISENPFKPKGNNKIIRKDEDELLPDEKTFNLASETSKISVADLGALKEGFRLPCVDRGWPFPPCSHPISMGSNSWILNRSFTGTDQTLLSNDPHLMLTTPSLLYPVGIDNSEAKVLGGEFKPLKVWGMAPAGAPGVLIGANGNVMWGLTNLDSDVEDLYIEALDQDEKNYVWARKTQKVEERPFTIKVRTTSGTTIEHNEILRIIPEHGPIVSDHIPEMKKWMERLNKFINDDGQDGRREMISRVTGAVNTTFAKSFRVGISYKWVGHRGTSELKTVYGLNHAKDVGEIRKALDYFEVGSQNVIFADRTGKTQYYGHGYYPMRKYLNREVMPWSPVFSGVKAKEWDPIPRQDIPEVVNPKKGYIVTANNDPLGHSLHRNLSDFEDYFGFAFDPGFRAERIRQRIEEEKKRKGILTYKDMQSIQMDKVDIGGLAFVNQLQKWNLWDELSKESDEVKLAAEMVKNWNGNTGINERAPVIAYEFLFYVYKDYMIYREDNYPQSTLARLKRILEEASRGGIVHAATDDALQDLVKELWEAATKRLASSSLGVKTVYHLMNDGLLNAPDSPAYKEVRSMIKGAFISAVKNLVKTRRLVVTTDPQKHLSLNGVGWGSQNRLSFYNSLKEILPPSVTYPVERAGAPFTISPLFPTRFNDFNEGEDRSGVGSCFRLVMSMGPAGTPMKTYAVIPGGNWSPLIPEHQENILRDIRAWNEGTLYELQIQ